MKDVVNVELGINAKTKEKYVRYTYLDGTDSFNVASKHAWRDNNPGNIQCSDDVKDYLKSVGCDESGFAIFPDYETGNWAMARLLRRWAKYKNRSVEEAIKKYSPKKDGNPTEKYIQYVSQKSGLPRTKVILDMTDGEFERFQRAMREFEDSTPGYSLTDFGNGAYYKQEYLKINKDKSSRDSSNYGLNIPIRFKDDGFKTKRRIPVASSNVKSIGYDENRQTLEVEFDDGGIYKYFNVPLTVYERFFNAGSKGKFLHREIKETYNYSRIN